MDVYDDILDIVKNVDDLEGFLTECPRDAYAYNLSVIRHNILEWYDFREGARLLELGAGCGALTGLLCEKLGEVTAVDKNARKCTVNSLRNNEYSNLTIDCIDILSRKASKRFEHNYDYVTMVGIYNEEVLGFAKNHLEEDGTLIVALDKDYDKSVAGLKRNGFDITDIYYPFPDYKLPVEIYNKDYISENAIKGNNNSYILMCQPKSTISNHSTNKTLYAKYNSRRKPEYQVATYIVSENGQKKVIKKPQSNKAAKHIDTILENYDKLKGIYKDINVVPYKRVGDHLESEYIEGSNLADTVDLTELLTDNKDRVVTQLSETIDNLRLQGLGVCNLDAVLSNFIITDTGMSCIDYEWVVDEVVSTEFWKYRILLYFYIDNIKKLETKYTLEEFVSLFGYNDKDTELYRNMEVDFQAKIGGPNYKYAYMDRLTTKESNLSKVKKLNGSARKRLKPGKTPIRYCIDTLDVGDDVVTIEGWVIWPDKKNNNNIDVKLILDSEDNSYMITTEKVYRQDVADVNGDVANSENTGFKSVFIRSQTESVEYIILLTEGKKLYRINKRM